MQKANVTHTFVKDMDGQYYLVMADGELTLEDALAQGKACPVDADSGIALSKALIKAFE